MSVNGVASSFQDPSIKKKGDVMLVNVIRITLTAANDSTPMKLSMSVVGCFKEGESSLIGYHKCVCQVASAV